MNSRKKNRKREIGAEKVTLLTQGPGLSLLGITMPILTPVRRLEYCHFSSHPSLVWIREVGEILFWGKSIFFEIGLYAEQEIPHLTYVLAKFVPPLTHSL